MDFYRINLVLIVPLFLLKSTSLYTQEFNNEKELSLQADSIFKKGILHLEQDQYQKSIAEFEKSAQLYNRNKNLRKLGDANFYLGFLYSHLGNYEKALEYYQISKTNYKTTGNEKGLGNVANNIGSIYFYLGDYPQTLSFYKESLHYRKALKDTNGIAVATQNIGLLFSNTKDFSQAYNYYQHALSIFEKLGNREVVVETLSNLGSNYTQQKQYVRAEEILLQALEVADEVDNRRLRLGVVSSLAELAQKQLKNDEASLLYRQALTLADSLNSPRHQSEAQIALGILDIRSFNFREAEQHCVAGLEIARELQSASLQREAYDCLYQSYKHLGDPEKSLYAYERSNYFKDQLKTDETANQLLSMEFQNQQLADSLAHAQKEHVLELAHQTQIRRKERQRNGVIVSLGFIVIIAGGLLSRLNFVRKSKKLIEFEKQRSDDLLLNILPEKIAEELKDKGEVQAQGYQQVGVLFTDFKSFTQTAQKMTPQEIVEELNTCFKTFDRICEQYQIEKIKTIGDAYMAVSGIPIPYQDAPARIVKAGLAMQEFMSQRRIENKDSGSPIFEMRVGIHTGPLIAGVVGLKKFQYDVWGDTVNTASRMESSCLPGKVNISQSLYEVIRSDASFSFECRGSVYAKGKGELTMYFVEKAENHKKEEDKMTMPVVG